MTDERLREILAVMAMDKITVGEGCPSLLGMKEVCRYSCSNCWAGAIKEELDRE